MKIVFISDACLPSPSAEALFVVRMAQALSEHGHEVILLVPGGKHDRHTDTQAIAAYYGIIPAFTTQPVAWPGGAKAIRLWAWRSARAAQHWAPDLVYARHIAAGWAALEAGLPNCAGVAVGFDRVVMLALGVKDLAQVLTFRGQ